MFNHSREVTLQRVIGRFHGVRKATVIIDPTNERHISGSITPSSLVDIQTRGERGGADEANPRQLASAAINALTGAVSTMERQKVKVTIDGASYNVGSPVIDGDEVAGDVLERRQQCEQVYVAKVRQQLKFIPDVLVSVSVDLNLQSQEEEKHTFDPQNTVQNKVREQVRSEERDPATAEASAALANAVPEMPEKIVTARPAARTEDTTTEYSVQTGETIQKSRNPAGKETVLSASVAVPRSYFVNIYQRASKKPSAEPDDALLQPVVDAHVPKIRNLVRTTLGIKNDDVSVEVYDDATPAPVPAVPASAGAILTTNAPSQASILSTPAIALLMTHWREASYAAAGMVMLLLFSVMLRRGGEANAPKRESSKRQPQLAVAGASPRVRIARPAPVMTSIEDEMDDDTRDLLRQVRELASREPEEAARILRDWIDED